MRQNRSSVSSKGQRRNLSQINCLKDNLMTKISGFQGSKASFLNSSDQKRPKYSLGTQIDDLQVISFEVCEKGANVIKSKSILQKAKQITRSNRDRIESAKKAYKKTSPEKQGMFLTGCGLYKADEQQQPERQDFQPVDMNDALKFLVSHQKDDLEELRRMINKTSFDIRQYSEEVSKTTSQISNAADLFGTDFNTDLRVKINRCKPLDNGCLPNAGSQRKISTSSKNRPKH